MNSPELHPYQIDVTARVRAAVADGHGVILLDAETGIAIKTDGGSEC